MERESVVYLSRALNSPSRWFGLGLKEAIFAMGIVAGSSSVLPDKHGWLALTLGVLTLLLFIPIRLKFRPKIIRDSLVYGLVLALQCIGKPAFRRLK